MRLRSGKLPFLAAKMSFSYHTGLELPTRVRRWAGGNPLLDGRHVVVFHFGQLTIELTQRSWLGFLHQTCVELLGTAFCVERYLQSTIAGRSEEHTSELQSRP